MEDRSGATIEALTVAAFEVPTEEQPESDGTLEWASTTMVFVEARSGDVRGLGYSYSHAAAAYLVDHLLRKVVEGTDAMQVGAAWRAMIHALRNVGASGLALHAVSAVDAALWDLKARLLGLPLVDLLPALRADVPVYGSGGFTSYSEKKLCAQLRGWAERGFHAVKMKIGRRPDADVDRVAAARAAVGDDVELMVDANGAFTWKQALAYADTFAGYGVTWFEEPVSSDDLEGLRRVRDHGPAGMDVAAGEYGHDLSYFRRMLGAGAVDVLQADLTRCGGVTGFLAAATLCQAHGVDLSAHTAPNVHAHVCCAAPRVRHVEYFFDHARIEDRFFDGGLEPDDGLLRPDRTRPGMGFTFRWQDAEPYRVY